MPHRTILIVEDDADIRQTLCTALELEGYTVRTAQNGQEGIDTLKEAIPSLILLDLMMPVMDGWQFLAQARANAKTAKIPVIVLSATEFNAEKDDGTHFLKKPFDLMSLLKKVESFLNPAPQNK